MKMQRKDYSCLKRNIILLSDMMIYHVLRGDPNGAIKAMRWTHKGKGEANQRPPDGEL